MAILIKAHLWTTSGESHEGNASCRLPYWTRPALAHSAMSTTGLNL